MATNLLGFIKVADYSAVTNRTKKQQESIDKVIEIRDKYINNPTDKNKIKLIEALKKAEKLHPLTNASGTLALIRDDISDTKEMWERGNKIRSIVPASHLLISAPFTVLREPVRLISRAINPKNTFLYKETKEIKNESDPDIVQKIVNEHIDDLDYERADPARTIYNPSLGDFVATGFGVGGALIGNPLKLIPVAIRAGSMTANTIGKYIGANGMDRETYAARKANENYDTRKKLLVHKKKKKEDYVDQINRLVKV